MCTVIAVSGHPGSGKSTLIQSLLQHIPRSMAVYMDDYESFTSFSPDQMQRWLARGANPNEFSLPTLEKHLGKLKHQEPPPQDSYRSNTREYNVVFFETQFGKLHQQTGQFIDFQVWISLPPEIALSRQLGAIIDTILQSPTSEHTAGLGWLRNYMSEYSRFVRRVLLAQQHWFESSADLILDGTRDTSSNAALFIDSLMKYNDS